MKIYCDTNFYLDYLENRTDRFRPLGDFAFEVLRRTINCEFEIIISDFVIYELENFVKEDRINDLLASLKKVNKLIIVNKSRADVKRSRLFRNKPAALHAILARKAKAEYVVTRNIKDFIEFSDLIKPILPENL